MVHFIGGYRVVCSRTFPSEKFYCRRLMGWASAKVSESAKGQRTRVEVGRGVDERTWPS